MLTLSSHDFSNDEDRLPQHAITQATRKGEIWQIGVGGTAFKNGARAIICQKETSPLLWLTHAGAISYRFNTLSEVVSRVPADPFGLRMTFAHSFGGQRWGRAFFLNARLRLRQRGESAHFFLLLSPHGWAILRDLVTVLTPATSDKRQVEFTWSHNNEHDWLLTSSASQILARVEPQFDDTNSELNFARTFAAYSVEEQRNAVWSCQHGDVTEMQSVLAQAMLAQEQLCEAEPECTWAITLGGNSLASSYIYVGKYEEAPSHDLNEALKQVLEVFKPRCDSLATKRHLCIQLGGYNHLHIEIDNPTFHERLEATLRWRDWLVAHYPATK